MLNLPGLFAQHLQGEVTSLTVCWAVTRNNGAVIRGTAHDRDVTLTTGPYAGTYSARTAVFSTDVRSTSDGSVSNLDVEGAMRVDAQANDIKTEEIEGGLYDQAKAVLFAVNWREPDSGMRILASGTLGEFTRDSDGRYRSEVRGLTQALAQQIVQTASSMCNVTVFGDSRCKFNVGAVTRTGTITSVTDRRRFAAQLDPGPTPVTEIYFNGGRLKFGSGDNVDVIREVRVCSVDEQADTAEVLLWDEAPADIEIGDTFELPPGCDRQEPTCRLVHNNLVNFRGYGIYAAGRDALLRGPNDGGDSVWGGMSQAAFEQYIAETVIKAIKLL